jgi:hypothetical protein
VAVRPKAEDLPPFAKDFKVEIVGKRGPDGVLVAVKKDRDQLAADANMPRYAEITGAQSGWRFDFVILEAENSIAREVRGAQEPSDDKITESLAGAEHLFRAGYPNPAMLTAWAGLEAAMRRSLRDAGETAAWGNPPRTMLNELYSAGTFSVEEFHQLETLYRLRNEIVHGFAAQAVDGAALQFLIETTRRLLAESQAEKQTA